MAQKVLILGDSGSGKSASLRNFAPEEVFVINSAGKPLPFKNHFETVTPSFQTLTRDVIKAMDSTKKKVIIVDDAQYIMSFQFMRRIKENGWDKWNDIQGDFFNIIQHVDDLPSDTIVYFLSHIQRDEEGREKLKTMGKMLDEKITLEGLFTVVLKTVVTDGEYCFVTQTNGKDTVKSPIGMFDRYAIDNDLKYVDTKIRNYYEIGEYKSDDEVKAMDQEVAKDIEKPERTTRRRRTSAPAESVAAPMEEPEGMTEPEKSTVDNSEQVVENNAAEADPVEQTETAPRRRRRRNVVTEEDIKQTDADFENADIPF